MQRVAFKMTLLKGREAEYKKRHDSIWPDLKHLLKQAGIADYSIFLDASTGTLFGYLTIENPTRLDELRNEPLMWTWWTYMKDLMETNEDHSPLSIPLTEVFYMD
jgi:L-rhamnose mutarotase